MYTFWCDICDTKINYYDGSVGTIMTCPRCKKEFLIARPPLTMKKKVGCLFFIVSVLILTVIGWVKTNPLPTETQPTKPTSTRSIR